MLRSKDILTAVSALAVVFGIGFVMQRSETAERFYGAESNGSDSQMRVLESSGPKDAILEVQEIKLTSAELDTEIQVPATDSDVKPVSIPARVLEEPVEPEAAVGPGCDISANARPIAAVMVELSMTASCLPNERITVHHNGMIFTETTSDEGTILLKVPALSEKAVFILAFGNGDGAVAQTTVEELSDFDRVVLQWKGQSGLQVHAREFGAEYGSDGHIWSGNPGDIASAVSGENGMLSLYGDTSAADPLLAEVYSFPKGATKREGRIALSVEAEVTAANCGVEVEAQTLEVQSAGDIKTQNLTLPVPACDAEGSFLVLNNLLQDLKVAGK